MTEADHISNLTAAMLALKPEDAVSITFTHQRDVYWVCHIWRSEGSAYGIGATGIIAYFEALHIWAAQNPEAPAGGPATIEGQ